MLLQQQPRRTGRLLSDLGIEPARLQRFYASAAEGQRFADEMARTLDVLTSQRRDVPPRQRTLRAAFDPDAGSGDYYGPSGFMEMQGYPVKVKSNKRSHDQEAAGKLWDLSETMTAVSYQ